MNNHLQRNYCTSKQQQCVRCAIEVGQHIVNLRIRSAGKYNLLVVIIEETGLRLIDL